jgi:hypothetical protein
MMAMTTESTTGASMGSSGREAVLGGSGAAGAGPSDTGAVEHSPQHTASPTVTAGNARRPERGVDALLGQSKEQRTEPHP